MRIAAHWRSASMIVVAVACAALLYGLNILLTFRPGGAAAYQDEAPALTADGRVGLVLRLAVWGEGGPASGRFSGVRLEFRDGAGQEWRAVEPSGKVETMIVGQGQQLRYRFTLPPGTPLPKATDYRFVYQLDQQAQTLPGRDWSAAAPPASAP
jgi:hypothetical protein